MAQMRFLVGLDQLSLGSQTDVDLLDSAGSVAVPEGSIISPDLLLNLRKRSVVGLFAERRKFLKPAGRRHVVGIEAITPVIQEMQIRANIDPMIDDTDRREIYALTREILNGARMGMPIDYAAIDDLVRYIQGELHSRVLRIFKNPAHDVGREYLLNHSVNSMLAILAMGGKLGIGDDESRRLAMGALLHDIGKTRVDPSILEKPGALNREELIEVRRHPSHGLKLIMRKLVMGDDACRLVLHHHERYDGKGYPMHLGRETISRGARMMAIVDAYDAMTSDRAYARKLTPHQAVQQIVAGSGTQFDPSYSHEFLSLTGAYPDGSVVELNSGEIGVVTLQTPAKPVSPKLEIFFGPSRQPLPKVRMVDLAEDSTRHITGELHGTIH